MKTIVMGDTHGRDYWKQIVDTQTFDELILIGDYFDARDEISGKRQKENFEALLKEKETLGPRLILLIGNHDYHYTWYAHSIEERYSGYQRKLGLVYGSLIDSAVMAGKLQMAYESQGFMFTHAGITLSWLTAQLHYLPKEAELAVAISELFKYKPGHFRFMGVDPYGDDTSQSPIWVRPMSLLADAVEGVNQVVGHTSMGRINPEGVETLNGGEKVYFIDTLGSTGEYLIIDDGVVSVGKVAIPEKGKPWQKHKHDET